MLYKNSQQISRRTAMRSMAGIAALSSLTSQGVSARQPISRDGEARFRLGLAAYSLRPKFQFMKGKRQRLKSGDAPGMTMLDFLDYCVEMNVDGAELTSYFIEPGSDGFPTDDHLRDLRHAAFVRGLTICGTAIGNNFTVGPGEKMDREIAAAQTWIRKASVLGAPHIRFFAGTAAQLASAPTRMEEAIEGIQKCAALAAKHGIFLGVENHGKLSADQMIQLIRGIESRWVGINLDTGNFISDDPYADLERCVPYAVNVQVKVTMTDEAGNRTPADIPRIASILRESGYQGFVVLEYEEDDRTEGIPRALEELREALFG
ncbi:MAG: sugar phosphate isomerase/epimerase family protein [Planctomycetota bacterium]